MIPASATDPSTRRATRPVRIGNIGQKLTLISPGS
jgi:hypothetical protein